MIDRAKPRCVRPESDPDSKYVTVTREEIEAMNVDELKSFAKSLGLNIDRCESLGQARTALLGSAVGFQNAN